MCKAPVPGSVKTRLLPAYTATEASEIHQSMAKTVIMRAVKNFSNVCIACDDVEHPFFNLFPLKKIAQGEGDLGMRMTRLLKQAFVEGAQSVLFLGTDSPHMPESRLHEAVELLSEFDGVLGPVEDGGYDLIAMNRPHIELFKDISWGSEHVFKQTMLRAQTLNISMGLLETGFDLDTPESLDRVSPVWKPSMMES